MQPHIPAGPDDSRFSADFPSDFSNESPHPCHPDAAALFRACVGKHDEDAWKELSEHFGPIIRKRLARVARLRGLVLSREETHELCQDFFLRLFTCKITFYGRTRDEVWAYITEAVHNLVADFNRYRNAQRRRGFSGSVRIAGSSEFRVRARFGVLATRERNPEDALLTKEKVRTLTRHCLCRKKFPEDCHVEAVRMTLFEGWTSKETSRRLHGTLTPKQVDNVIGRLRQLLGKEGLVVDRRPNLGSDDTAYLLPPARRVLFNAREIPRELHIAHPAAEVDGLP